MCSHRPYRPALGIHKALAEIAGGKGTLYDTKAVNACIKLFLRKHFEFK
jgi:HD-GYP domain-containing protein (c-di-GMP phosphodiesterase class II)